MSAAGSTITVAGYAPARLDVPGDEIVPWDRQPTQRLQPQREEPMDVIEAEAEVQPAGGTMWFGGGGGGCPVRAPSEAGRPETVTVTGTVQNALPPRGSGGGNRSRRTVRNNQGKQTEEEKVRDRSPAKKEEGVPAHNAKPPELSAQPNSETPTCRLSKTPTEAAPHLTLLEGRSGGRMPATGPVPASENWEEIR